MSVDVYSRIKKNPKFHQLVRQRSGYAWLLSAVVLVLFYGFILVVAFNPGVMAQRLGGPASLITLGPVLIFSMFVLFWGMTALYVRRANSEFDDLTRALIEEATAPAPRGGKK